MMNAKSAEQHRKTAERLRKALDEQRSDEIFLDTHQDEWIRAQLLLIEYLSGQSNRAYTADCIFSLLVSSALEYFADEIAQAEIDNSDELSPDQKAEAIRDLHDRTSQL